MSNTIDAPETIVSPDGLSRRDALKRGALVGGALIWAVPTVQTIAMSAAHAAAPSNVGPMPSNIQIIVQYCANPAPSGVKSFKPYGLKYDIESGSWDKAPTDDSTPTSNRCLYSLPRSVPNQAVKDIFTAGAGITQVNRTIGGVQTSGISLTLPNSNWQYVKSTDVNGTKVESAYTHDGQYKNATQCGIAFADPQAPGAFYFPKPN